MVAMLLILLLVGCSPQVAISTNLPSISPTELGLHLYFHDDFSDPQSGWDEHHMDLWKGVYRSEYEDGHFVIANARPGYMVWARHNLSLDDFFFEVEAILEEIEGFENQLSSFVGVILRFKDESNFYFFGINGLQQFIAGKVEGGTWKSFYIDDTFQDFGSSESIRLGTGVTNKIMIVAQGSEFCFYVNDELVLDASDSSFADGDIALAVNWIDAPVVVYFDNAKLWWGGN